MCPVLQPQKSTRPPTSLHFTWTVVQLSSRRHLPRPSRSPPRRQPSGCKVSTPLRSSAQHVLLLSHLPPPHLPGTTAIIISQWHVIVQKTCPCNADRSDTGAGGDDNDGRRGHPRRRLQKVGVPVAQANNATVRQYVVDGQ